MIKRRQRDWFRILRDLMGVGVTMAEVGRLCGKDKGTVQHWSEGGDPKDADARVVLALYKKHCPELYEVHMAEFEPDVLEYVRQVVFVKPDRAIRGRPRPRRVAVVASGQFEFFVTEAA